MGADIRMVEREMGRERQMKEIFSRRTPPRGLRCILKVLNERDGGNKIENRSFWRGEWVFCMKKGNS